VDARGLVLAPGFIDAWTELGLLEVQLEESANDTGPRKKEDKEPQPIHVSLRAADSFNGRSSLLPVARLGGITTALSSPSGGLVSGQAALVSTDGGLEKPFAALVIRLGLSGRTAVGSTHGASLELLRELFDDAREYAKRRQDFEQNRMRSVVASRQDLEALQPVLSGKVPVIVGADRQSDLLAALALGREYGLKLVLLGAAEGWLVAKEIAAARVPVIAEATNDLPANFDALASRLDNVALLSAAGVKVLIAPFGRPHMVRNIVQEAGNAVSWGLPYDEAIRAISANVDDAF
jgi:imidazolonepropionase-like amidohydrolase